MRTQISQIAQIILGARRERRYYWVGQWPQNYKKIWFKIIQKYYLAQRAQKEVP